jgi:hypothetical protein
MVCTDAAIGRTVQTSTWNVYSWGPNLLTYYEALIVVTAALMYLC